MAHLDLRREAEAHKVPLDPPAALRDAALATWRGRMINEHQSSVVFDGLAAQLAEAGLDDALVAECAAFAAEERRHGVLCGAVVASLGGEATADLPSLEAFPAHEDSAPLEGALRNVLSVCCLSETVAVALIGAERLEMPEGPLRDLLTRIYADECGHSNFGWRVLREVLPDDAELKARLGVYLEVAFAHLEAHELAHLPVSSRPPAEGAALGICDGADARALFYAAVHEVILPGLEAHGLPARRAWEARRRELYPADSRTVGIVREVRAAASA